MALAQLVRNQIEAGRPTDAHADAPGPWGWGGHLASKVPCVAHHRHAALRLPRGRASPARSLVGAGEHRLTVVVSMTVPCFSMHSSPVRAPQPECRTAGHHGWSLPAPLAGASGRHQPGGYCIALRQRSHTRLFDEAHALVPGHLQAGGSPWNRLGSNERVSPALVIRQTETAVVAHAPPRHLCASVHHDVLGRTHGPRQHRVAAAALP